MQDTQNPIIQFLIKVISQIPMSIVSGVGLFGLIYLIFWVIFAKPLAKYKVQLSKRAGWSQIKFEITNTILVVATSGVFTGVILWLKDNGMTQFYTDTGKFGWWYEVLAIFILLLINDGWFYLVHRIIHHPKIYKFIHAEHHRSLDTTPFTSQSFHVLEPIFLTTIIIPTVMIMPVSLLALGVTQVVGMFNNIKSHLGYEFYPKWFANVFPLNMLVTRTNHNLHHTRYNGNYGLMFRHWDIICGTEIKDTQDVFRAIHDRKSATIIDNTKYQKVTITNIVHQTADTTSVYFQSANPDFYNYLAGQYVNIRIKVNGKMCDRCFSLSSSPIDKFLRITVKLNGEVSHHFLNNAKAGDTFESLMPVGDFGIETKPENQKNYLMVAGGSGITPLYSMINTILTQEPLSKITLLYANKSKELTIFERELVELQNKHKDQFEYTNFISSKNRISKGDIAKFVESKKDYELFVCGPQSLKDAVNSYVKELSIKNSFHSEDFVDGYVPWFGLFGSKL